MQKLVNSSGASSFAQLNLGIGTPRAEHTPQPRRNAAPVPVYTTGVSMATSHQHAGPVQVCRRARHRTGLPQARDVRVIAEDAEGNQVATKTIAAIDAPLDLKPRRKIVTFSLPEKPSRIRLQFTGPEITDVNNIIAIR